MTLNSEDGTTGSALRRSILIATGNAGKLREIRAVLVGAAVDWLGLADVPGGLDLPEPVEDGETFLANARRKAMHYAKLTGLWTLADDSGLEVDCLDGRPGVFSARFAGPQRDDSDNNAKLVQAVRCVTPQCRTARFRCAVVLADPDRVLEEAEGFLEGRIVAEPRGSGGFGYDPHFLVPDLGKTTAELTRAHKNRISHRGLALRAIREKIERRLPAAE